MNSILLLLLTWVLNAATLAFTAAVVPGVKIKNFKAALLGALAIGFVVMFVKPVVLLLSIPLLVLTLGLFYFVVVPFLFWVASAITPGFEVHGVLPGFIGAAILSLANWGLSFFVSTPTWW